MEDECVPLVNSRDIDAVAVEVLASGWDAGEMGNRFVSGTTGGGGGCGKSSRILRRLFTVILARQSSEDDEEDKGEHSSIVGIGFGVCERERIVIIGEHFVEREMSGVFAPRSVLELELRLERKEDRRDDKADEEVEGPA